MSTAVSDELLSVLERLSFLPEPSDLVALIIPDASNPYFTQLAFELGQRLRAEGLTLIACSSAGLHSRELQLAAELQRINVKAIFLCACARFSPQETEALIRLRLPIIQIDRRDASLPFASVTIDALEGVKLAVSCLADIGRLRLAAINGPDSVEAAAVRRLGFEKICRDRDITVVDTDTGDFSFSSGYVAATRLVNRRGTTPWTGLFCANDAMAIGALRALSEGGLRVPDDVAVVGFDAIPIGDWLSPSLTSVEQPLTKLSDEAVTLLAKAFRRPTDDQQMRGYDVRVSPQLIRRGSA